MVNVGLGGQGATFQPVDAKSRLLRRDRVICVIFPVFWNRVSGCPEADNFEGDPAVGDVKKCHCAKG